LCHPLGPPPPPSTRTPFSCASPEALAIGVSQCLHDMVTGYRPLPAYHSSAAACRALLTWLALRSGPRGVPGPGDRGRAGSHPTLRRAPVRTLVARTFLAILRPWVVDLCANVPLPCPLRSTRPVTTVATLGPVVAAGLAWAVTRATTASALAHAWRSRCDRARARGRHLAMGLLACQDGLPRAPYRALEPLVARGRGLLALSHGTATLCRATMLHVALGAGEAPMPVDRAALALLEARVSAALDGALGTALGAIVARRDAVVAFFRKYAARQAVIAECLAEEVRWLAWGPGNAVAVWGVGLGVRRLGCVVPPPPLFTNLATPGARVHT
jgi:hypothetical protein